MTVKNYFLEIKNRFFILFLVCLSVFLVCYTFKETLLFSIVKQSLSFCLKEFSYFIFTDVSEVFYVYIKLIFFLVNQILCLYFFYNLIIFISPGLYHSEYFYVAFIFKASFFVFIFSVFIYHKFFFPFSWNFFLSFQQFESLKTNLYFESKISEYLLFYISFYYICVFYFQIFVILLITFDFLKGKGVIKLKMFRKFFYYFFVIISTLITPPDVFSQLFLSVCFIFSYEIFVFYFISKKVLLN
jgi:sec-independent protein translocase protein TatC